MLRKVGFLFALMLTVPALANAWTLAAKVTGASGSGSITAAGTVVSAGSKYISVTDDASVTVIAPAAGYKTTLVTVDGVAVKDGLGALVTTAPITITAPVAPKYSRSVVAYFSPITYKVSVSQVAGGTVTAQVVKAGKGLGAISRGELKNLPNGTTVKIMALPNADYKVTSVAGVATPTAEVGRPQSAIVTIASADQLNLAAAFTQVASVKPELVVRSLTGALLPTVLEPSSSVVLDAKGTRSNGAVTYAWSGCGAAGTADTAAITTPASGSCTATVTVTSAIDASVKTASLTLNVTGGDVSNACLSCHTNRGAADQAIITSAATMAYRLNGNLPTCAECHTAAPHAVKCANCHSNTQSHAFGVAGPTVAIVEQSCIACHDVAIKHPGNKAYVNDNNGVRAITGEFTKWSHHVTGSKLQDAHCAACHLEGKVVAGKVVIDTTKHMADATTHLRNVDTDADIVWNPATPDHTAMDNFCMSCHDANGATSAMSQLIQAVIVPATGKVASASNPFGDTISNRYDKMQRPAVVDAKGQFDLSNPSHHAVLGQKYSGRTRTAGDPRVVKEVAATFAANSSATLPGKRSTIYDSRVKKTNLPAQNYDVSKFVESYQTLSPAPGTADKTLGDDSILHCGDCHTVGQYRLADKGVLPKNAAVIGAHGSNNEYMLRNSIGTDERHVGQTYSSASGINYFTNPTTQPWLVCFNCHSYQAYGSIGNATGATGTNHAGEYANSNRCNGPVNTINFAGYTTSVGDETEPYAFRLGLGQKDKTFPEATTTSDTDFSNLFGMQCANCHNAGPNNLFGGIHGAKVQTYSDANGASQKAYRFLPGLGNTMYVPGSAAGVGSVSDLNWEVKAISTKYNTAGDTVVDNGGCYTIVPEAGPEGDAAHNNVIAEAPYSVSPAFEQTVNQPAAGTKIFGTWGGCDDHRGNAHGKAFATGSTIGQAWDSKTSSYVNTGIIDPVGGTVPTGGAAVTRKVLRPVTY